MLAEMGARSVDAATSCRPAVPSPAASRQPRPLSKSVRPLALLGTTGSIDASSRMVIKGRFPPKAIEQIIRRYVVEYVSCSSCKSPNTGLQKSNRLYFMQCNNCGARRSVTPIKTGFVAISRGARRAKRAA